MRYEDLDQSDMPLTHALVHKVYTHRYVWEMYRPGTNPEDDAPFGQDWWKYLYWVPRLKPQFYDWAVFEPDYFWKVEKYCLSLGMDLFYFHKYYKHLFKRMAWMRAHSGQTKLGEIPL